MRHDGMNTACEAFRESLERMARQRDNWHPGEILQMFDQLHQSHRENTGDKCKVRQEPKCICNPPQPTSHDPICPCHSGTCSQCGKLFKEPACGPTHALIAKERKQIESGEIRASVIDGVPLRVQVYVPAGKRPRQVLELLERVLKEWLHMEHEMGTHRPDLDLAKEILFLNFKSALEHLKPGQLSGDGIQIRDSIAAGSVYEKESAKTPPLFCCPECGAQHKRGYFPPGTVGSYRCLNCGYQGPTRYQGPTKAL